MVQFIIYLIFIELINISSLEFSYSRFNTLIREKEIKNTLDNLIYDENKIKIINNPNQKWLKDCFEINCYNEKISFTSISYHNFYNDLYKPKDFIFVEDFMVGYGRTLIDIEKNKIINYNKNSKLILQVNDYENLVLKEDEFIKKYKMYNFPKITKRHINNYIFNMIEYYNYHKDLLLINWKKFDIDKLDYHKLEDILFSMHLIMISNNQNIEYYEYIIQDKLRFLNKKYYD